MIEIKERPRDLRGRSLYNENHAIVAWFKRG